jgi:hypothetical protein
MRVSYLFGALRSRLLRKGLLILGSAALLLVVPAIAQDLASSSDDALPDGPSAVRPASLSNSQPSTEPPSKVESSIFSSLFMAGKTQDQFEPLTPKERVVVYSKDLFGPVSIFLAGFSAGVTQAQGTPREWGGGAAGYGIRFANYYGEVLVADVLQMSGEDLLHEDNLYYGSGEHGIWRRTGYAIKSSVLARGRDGTQHFSISQVGSTAGASFISRIWQPPSSNSAADGAKNFGISLASNAGVNVVREFLPDATHRIFHRTKQRQQ